MCECGFVFVDFVFMVSFSFFLWWPKYGIYFIENFTVFYFSHKELKNKYKKIIAGITRLMAITRINNDAETA